MRFKNRKNFFQLFVTNPKRCQFNNFSLTVINVFVVGCIIFFNSSTDKSLKPLLCLGFGKTPQYDKFMNKQKFCSTESLDYITAVATLPAAI